MGSSTPIRFGIWAALSVFAAATIWINYEVKVNIQRGRSSETVKEMGNVKVGQLAPDFSTMDLSNHPVSLDGYRQKKVVLLDFWATWCAPCRMEMVQLQTLQDKFKNKGFEILSLNQGEDLDQVAQFIKHRNYDFHVLLDSDGAVGNKYGVRAIPTLVLVDRKGIIQWLRVGYDNSDGDLDRRIQKLLAN